MFYVFVLYSVPCGEYYFSEHCYNLILVLVYFVFKIIAEKITGTISFTSIIVVGTYVNIRVARNTLKGVTYLSGHSDDYNVAQE
jgi:hypothetical protein